MDRYKWWILSSREKESEDRGVERGADRVFFRMGTSMPEEREGSKGVGEGDDDGDHGGDDDDDSDLRTSISSWWCF